MCGVIFLGTRPCSLQGFVAGSTPSDGRRLCPCLRNPKHEEALDRLAGCLKQATEDSPEQTRSGDV